VVKPRQYTPEEEIVPIDSPETDTILSVGEIRMNVRTHAVFVRGTRINFEERELQYLAYFMRNPDTVIPKKQLMDAIYPEESLRPRPDDKIVKTMISKIRSKLKPYLGEANYFRVFKGRGYILSAP